MTKRVPVQGIVTIPGIVSISAKAAASRRGCEAGASRGTGKITSEQAGRKTGDERVCQVLTCGFGFAASSFARTSHVTGKRIIHDGMQFEADLRAGNEPGGCTGIQKAGGRLAL